MVKLSKKHLKFCFCCDIFIVGFVIFFIIERMRENMKEKLSLIKNALGRFNAKRAVNSEKYKMTNILLTVLFPVFIVFMAEINQGKYPSKFILFLAERPTVVLFNVFIASLIFYGFVLLFRKGWIAVVIQSFIYMTLSITELFKFNTNGNHLIMTDMKLVKSVKSFFRLY